MSTTQPTLLAVAHGTKDPAGIAVLHHIIELVRQAEPDVPAVLCFLQAASPPLNGAVRNVTGPAVLIPLLLSTGYHVSTEITRAVAGRRNIAVTEPLGPDVRITAAAQQRLTDAIGIARQRSAAAGKTRDETEGVPERVVIAAGSSDPAALRQLQEVAQQLASLSPGPVRARQLTDDDPFADIDGDALVVNYLLAPGYFDSRLRQLAGSRVVGDPVGAHRLVVEVVLDRYRGGVQALDSRLA